jgi:hypothetical protein
MGKNRTLDRAEIMKFADAGKNSTEISEALGINSACIRRVVREERSSAARHGELGFEPVLPGFRIKSTAKGTANYTEDGKYGGMDWIKQVPDVSEEIYEIPEGLKLKGESALVDGAGNVIQKWVKSDPDLMQRIKIAEMAKAAFMEDFPSEPPSTANVLIHDGMADRVNQYTVTDLHFGMLSWGAETGADWDLKIAEQLLLDWFKMAIRLAPSASVGILAQLGDLLHHDAHISVTPTHAHVLDADSRLQKMIQVVIRTMRRVVRMMLEKHQTVHIIMADANHDPAGGAWLREMFASFYEDEPRVTVDSSPSTYYVYEIGDTSLFYHHGHKRKINTVDSVFAGKFRQSYGRTKYSYAHIGHLHSDELKSTNLMKVERHETLAAPDAHAANGGWLSGRSAKVITYSRRFGECGRFIITPEMVASEQALEIYA